MHSPLLLPPDVLQQALDSPRGKAEIPAILARRARASSAAFTAEKAGLRNRNELTGAPASAEAPPAAGDVFAYLPSHPGRSPLAFGCSGLGVTREPSAAIGGVLRDCLPQYTLGHKSRLDELEAALAQHCPRLKAIGNSLYGVGIADTIATARRTAEAFAAEQQHRDGGGVEKIETEV